VSVFDIFRRRKERYDDSEFKIEDNGLEKRMKYGNITYSKLRNGTIYTHDYWDYFLPVAHLFEFPRVLMIGLGGGTVALQLRALLREKLDIEAVEISKRAVELSKEFVNDPELKITVGDGAEYVRRPGRKFNVIMLDAYVYTEIPKQFLNMQFIDDAYNALDGDGILAINYAVGMMGALRMNRYVSRLKARFRVFRVGTALFEGNLILVCSKKMGRDEMLSKLDMNMKRTGENEHLFYSYERMKEL
jgi:spermidine synthase